ncbi:hypothetical protein [Winogradskyella sp. MIT101101]
MQKILVLIITTLVYQLSFSQSNLVLDFDEKKDYVSIKSLDKELKDKIRDYIILDKDTLVNLSGKVEIKDVEKFCKYFKKNESIRDLINAIQFELPKNRKLAETKQWNSKIIVFIDKNIPRKLKKNFITFFKQIDSVNNFELSFSKSLDDSNYVIKVSDTLIPNFKTDSKDFDELSPYSKATYNLISDNNNKFYSGTLLIDESVLNNEELSLKKLKQMFFMSLGPFVSRKSLPTESLLHSKYVNSNKLSEFDINLLRSHYFKIYPRPFTRPDLIEFNNKAKSICKNEQ